MAITAIAKVQTPDANVNQLQQNITQALRPLLTNPVLQGVVLPGVVLVVGSNTVAHKLGRVLQGWVVVRSRGASTIYDTQDSNTQTAQTLLLNSSAQVTVDIYVF